MVLATSKIPYTGAIILYIVNGKCNTTKIKLLFAYT